MKWILGPHMSKVHRWSGLEHLNFQKCIDGPGSKSALMKWNWCPNISKVHWWNGLEIQKSGVYFIYKSVWQTRELISWGQIEITGLPGIFQWVHQPQLSNCQPMSALWLKIAIQGKNKSTFFPFWRCPATQHAQRTSVGLQDIDYVPTHQSLVFNSKHTVIVVEKKWNWLQVFWIQFQSICFSQCRIPEKVAFKGIAGAIASRIVLCMVSCGAPMAGCPAIRCQGKGGSAASFQKRFAARSFKCWKHTISNAILLNHPQPSSTGLPCHSHDHMSQRCHSPNPSTVSWRLLNDCFDASASTCVTCPLHQDWLRHYDLNPPTYIRKQKNWKQSFTCICTFGLQENPRNHPCSGEEPTVVVGTVALNWWSASPGTLHHQVEQRLDGCQHQCCLPGSQANLRVGSQLWLGSPV